MDVDKGLVSRVLRRAPKTVGPIVRTGVTRAGTVGVEVEHQGVKGWGRDMSAARASWQQNASMSKLHDVGKSDSWEVPVDHFSPTLPNKRPNYGTGNTVGKRMTGVSAGVVKPKKLQPTRMAARRASGMLPIGQPPIAPGLVGKGEKKYRDRKEARRVMLYDERLPKVNIFDDRAKAYRKAKPMRQSMKEGLKAEGRGALEGSAPGAAVGALAGRHFGHTRAGALIGLGTGIYAGALTRGVKQGNKDRRDRLRILEEQGTLRKRDRSFNPEHNRQRRLGAASALAVGGGLALAGRGAQGVRRATAMARHDAAYDEGLLGYLHDHKTHVRAPKRGKKGEIISEPGHFIDRSESNALHRLATRPQHMVSRPTRRQGAQIAGGGALSTAGVGLAGYGRSRSNREYR